MFLLIPSPVCLIHVVTENFPGMFWWICVFATSNSAATKADNNQHLEAATNVAFSAWISWIQTSSLPCLLWEMNRKIKHKQKVHKTLTKTLRFWGWTVGFEKKRSSFRIRKYMNIHGSKSLPHHRVVDIGKWCASCNSSSSKKLAQHNKSSMQNQYLAKKNTRQVSSPAALCFLFPVFWKRWVSWETQEKPLRSDHGSLSPVSVSLSNAVLSSQWVVGELLINAGPKWRWWIEIIYIMFKKRRHGLHMFFHWIHGTGIYYPHESRIF